MKRFELLLIVTLALLLTTPMLARAGTFSVGAFGGWGWNMTDDAVKGVTVTFPWTEFESGAAYGGSIMYRFDNSFALELLVEKFQMDLVELDANFGTLNLTPVVLIFKFQGMPPAGRGGTGHFEIGG